ncbi:uncharacterized protein J4E78_006341 [Alternaria triticimaculans]|uniref:uncharacterized protein n=1 Tax=Alternaria triticimaculans TaxID=297637 RepID=UPI0020C31A70|nr:uncharacterized protein J4E78_006341 [Alternaria triticimaculans]KAI4657951.1 hypothetical protein J4E78_006341 [Alternaria triticimaculans]
MENFDWSRSDLNRTHFHSLANLLSLRNGGQVEPTVKFDTEPELDLEVNDEEDWESRSVNTALANQISESGHGKLKRRFLDAVAGFAANKKGGTAVACSAMKEAENDVVIWLARNDGFSNGDRPAFEKLGAILSSLSYNGVEDSKDLLWEHMVSYHSSRIKQDYIFKLGKSFKAYDAEQTRHVANTTADRSVVDAALSALRDLLFNNLPNDLNETRTLPDQPSIDTHSLTKIIWPESVTSLAEDLIPEEEEVLEDFGFNSVNFGQGRSYLFGVYAGLYRSGRFSAEDFHNWRIGGILTEKIKEFFYSLPEDSRGSYFPWFLENLPLLERPTTEQQAMQNLVASMFAKARPYLDIEDRNRALDELMPEAKRDSFTLLAQLSHQMSPNPIEQNWYSFGFVTCRGKSEENTLVQVYQLLLLEDDGSYFYKFYNSRRDHNSPVGLTQFWKAYEAGTLIQLMDSKGLKNFRSRLPLLEVFLSGSCSSVWDLKWFLDIEDPVKYPPIPSVSLDYGFVNCNTLEETYTLIEIYKRVLQTAHLLDLQHACITGTLWQFASSRIRMEEKWRPLMKKVYSLETPTVSETGEDMTPKAESEEHGEPVVVSSSLLSRLWGSLSVV